MSFPYSSIVACVWRVFVSRQPSRCCVVKENKKSWSGSFSRTLRGAVYQHWQNWREACNNKVKHKKSSNIHDLFVTSVICVLRINCHATDVNECLAKASKKCCRRTKGSNDNRSCLQNRLNRCLSKMCHNRSINYCNSEPTCVTWLTTEMIVLAILVYKENHLWINLIGQLPIYTSWPRWIRNMLGTKCTELCKYSPHTRGEPNNLWWLWGDYWARTTLFWYPGFSTMHKC